MEYLSTPYGEQLYGVRIEHHWVRLRIVLRHIDGGEELRTVAHRHAILVLRVVRLDVVAEVFIDRSAAGPAARAPRPEQSMTSAQAPSRNRYMEQLPRVSG